MSEQPKSPDPMERFRELITEWERGFDAMANRFMGTDEFSRAMNQFQNMQLGVQKAFAEATTKQLAAMNLPSREDILRVGEAVHELDARVARMELQLAELARASGVASARPRKGPPRTKRPPSAATEASDTGRS